MLTAPYNNMWTLKFKAQPTKLFVTANQIFGGSFQPPTTTEHMVIKSLNTVQTKKCSVLRRSWKLGGVDEHFIDSSKKQLCGLSFEFQSLHVIKICSKPVCLN